MFRKLALIAAVAALGPAATASDPSRDGVGYICGAELAGVGAGPRVLVRTPGIGNSRMAIATRSAEAQAWFDYGLQLADGFYHEDAKLAFARAVSLDPDCAMCLWGEAMARSDNLNVPAPKAEADKAQALLARAEKALRADASDRDRGLIAALKARYAEGGDGQRRYAEAMDAVARKHPDDSEVQVVAAQAWMMLGRGSDRGGVERAVKLLEGVLRREPEHAGAIHFYIHATEFAGRAGVALPYAEKLAGLSPMASHMVHMPAHTLIRMGRYEDAALLNARALGVEARYRKALNAPGPLGGERYYTHNLTFGVAGAMMAGDGPLAVKFAEHAQRAYPESLTPEQRDTAIGRSWMALGRFAPDQAMAIPEPGKDRTVLRLMRHYARGEAAAAKGDAAAVLAEAKAAEALELAPGPSTNLKKVAVLVLKGRAAMLSGDPQAAVIAYGEATDVQQNLMRGLMDPPPWWYPARRSLAAALLASGQYADAVAEARKSLEEWPADGLALRVLADAEAKLGRAEEAGRLRAQAKAAYLGDVMAIPAALV